MSILPKFAKKIRWTPVGEGFISDCNIYRLHPAALAEDGSRLYEITRHDGWLSRPMFERNPKFPLSEAKGACQAAREKSITDQISPKTKKVLTQAYSYHWKHRGYLP